MVYKPFRGDMPLTHLHLDLFETSLLLQALHAFDVENSMAHGETYQAAWDDKRRLLELLERRRERLEQRTIDDDKRRLAERD